MIKHREDFDMDYQEFEKNLVELIMEMLPEDYSLSVKAVEKNNGLVLNGLIINNKECNISPTIYLNYYFEEYKKGKSVDELAGEILDQYKKFELHEDFDVSQFVDYEKCKDNICFKLINFEKNKKLLDDVPFIDCSELAIVFYDLINSNSLETSSILIRNSHLKHWDKSVGDLMSVASKNTPRLLGTNMKNLNALVSEMLENNSGIKINNNTDEDIFAGDSPMYVLTNKSKLYGAACILQKDILDDFCNQQDVNDFYIIPSSIHEVLLLPKNNEYDDKYLSEMIKEVNSTELSVEDVLADRVFVYDRGLSQIYCFDDDGEKNVCIEFGDDDLIQIPKNDELSI